MISFLVRDATQIEAHSWFPVSGATPSERRGARVRGFSIPHVATRFLISFRAERGLVQLQIVDCL